MGLEHLYLTWQACQDHKTYHWSLTQEQNKLFVPGKPFISGVPLLAWPAIITPGWKRFQLTNCSLFCLLGSD
jgi:hypothetical protein